MGRGKWSLLLTKSSPWATSVGPKRGVKDGWEDNKMGLGIVEIECEDT